MENALQISARRFFMICMKMPLQRMHTVNNIQSLGETFNSLLQNFSGPEFDNHTFRDYDLMGRIARIPAFAFFPDQNFKNTEITQFDVSSSRQFIRKIIQRFLDNCAYGFLTKFRFRGDFDHQVTFCHCSLLPNV